MKIKRNRECVKKIFINKFQIEKQQQQQRETQ